MTEKLCTGCNKHLLLEFFSKDSRSKTGLQSKCKDCNKKYYSDNKKKILSARQKHYSDNRSRLLEQSRVYADKNKAFVLERKRRYYQEHKNELLARQAEYRRLNREKVLDGKKAEYRRHKDSYVARAGKRRRAVRLSGFDISMQEITKLKNSQCSMCESVENIEIDHIIPISRGGEHRIGNLQPLCRVCNGHSEKGVMFMSEWKLKKLKEAGKL